MAEKDGKHGSCKKANKSHSTEVEAKDGMQGGLCSEEVCTCSFQQDAVETLHSLGTRLAPLRSSLMDPEKSHENSLIGPG